MPPPPPFRAKGLDTANLRRYLGRHPPGSDAQMTVVLHIGTHKTGTTAIQRFAAANRAKLRSRGLWYPSYDEIKLFVHYGHHHIAHAIANENGNRLSIDETRRFVDHVRTNLRPGETLLISAEPFYRHLLPAEGGYWAQRKAYIERLRTFFPGEDVKVLAIVRRQDTFARSLYQERIKVTKFRQTFREFIADRQPFEYYEHFRIFEEVFGTVDVLLYEDLAAAGLINAFFSHLGIDVANITGRPSANPSLPVELTAPDRTNLRDQTRYHRLIAETLLDRWGLYEPSSP